MFTLCKRKICFSRKGIYGIEARTHVDTKSEAFLCGIVTRWESIRIVGLTGNVVGRRSSLNRTSGLDRGKEALEALGDIL